MKASFWGLFKTNFYGYFRKLFLFTKFNFLNFGKKFFSTILKSTCLEFCASNYPTTPYLKKKERGTFILA